MVDDARRQVINSRINGRQLEYLYRTKGYAVDRKKYDHTLSSLVKDTVKDLVKSKQLKQIYQKFLPAIDWLIYKSSNDVDRHGELKQLALIAIWSALCKHDGKTEIPSSHIYVNIKQAIRNGCLEDTENYGLKPPRTTYRKYQKGIKSYRKKYGCEPTNHQLAKHMGIGIYNVQQFFFRQTYESVTIEKSESVTFPLSIRSCQQGAWYWQRKNDYEDRLIYWIDRHWAKGVLLRLGKMSATAMKVKALGINAKEWSKKNGRSPVSCYQQQRKTIEWARLLEQYNYRPSDGDPKQFLQSKGYRVSKIWKKVLGKK